MSDSEVDYSRVAELHINKNDETVGVYAEAFLDAAAKIFEHGICDFAPYPGMFCLRHGLELFLKQVAVCQAYELRDKRLLYAKGHSLLKLWERVKPYLDDCFSRDLEVDAEALDRLDLAIGHVHDVDPQGTLYRYPEDIMRGVGRVDTHFPEDRVNLREWAALAGRLLGDCQVILSSLGERCAAIGHRRHEYGASLYDIVAKLPDVVEKA